MNRGTSSSNAKRLPRSQSQSQPQPQAAAKRARNVKRERFPANPLRALSTRSSGSSSCSSNVSGSESEADQRFLLSHSFSSSSSSVGVFPPRGNRPVRSLAKTPNSAPVAVVTKPLIRKKPNLQRCKSNSISGKRLEKGLVCREVLRKQTSVSRVVKLKDSVAQVNTPVSKLGNGSNGEGVEDDGSRLERTPPVQASVSPEIQCGSSMSLSVSACYAAGHLLSGVSDKRKCKPKGMLTVGKGKILNDSDEFSEGDFGGDVSVMPVDASEQWLLSPCDEEEEREKERFEDGLVQFQQVVECVGSETPSPLSDRSTYSDLCNISSGRSLSPMNVCRETARRISSSLSPNELSRFRRFIHLSSSDDGLASPFDTKLDACERLKDKPSPLSFDTLGSENVIQTPESNSSFDSYLRLLDSPPEFQKKFDVGSDLESLTSTLQFTRLSPRSHASPQEPSISSFNFDSLAATSSDSVDLSQFQRGVVDRSSHVTLDKVSRTHVSVYNHAPEPKPQQITDTELDMRNHKESEASQGKGRGLLPCSTAESISTDGGSLICSEDSNWMACYKS